LSFLLGGKLPTSTYENRNQKMSQTHNLKHNGAPYTQAGELVHADPSVTAGAGAALCTCGTLSEELPNGAARRRWHKEHKEQAAASAPVQEQLVVEEHPTTESLAELIGLPVAKRAPKAKEPRVTRAMARGELLATRKAKAAAAPTQPVDGYAEYSKTVTMDKAIKPGFWRSLGRDAAKTVVEQAYPNVQLEADNATFKLHLTGPQDDVDAAVGGIKQLWKDALAATKEWKATDAGFLGRSEEPLERRREGYHLTEEFYRAYGQQRADSLAGSLAGK
jgi:hypothetical protein